MSESPVELVRVVLAVAAAVAELVYETNTCRCQLAVAI